MYVHMFAFHLIAKDFLEVGECLVPFIVFGGAFFCLDAWCLPYVSTSVSSSVDFAFLETCLVDFNGWALFFAALQVFQPNIVSTENFLVDVRYVPAKASPDGCSDFFRSQCLPDMRTFFRSNCVLSPQVECSRPGALDTC
jgi:hypothetical protein